MKKDFCTLYLFRHGETEWNREKRMQGHSDSPLTEEGVEQAKQLARLFSGKTFSVCYSSDLSRALKTAEIVAGALRVPIRISPTLRERKFGMFEGTRRDDQREVWARAYEEHARLSPEEKWDFRPGDGVESNAELASRFMEELCRISRGHLGESVLVSTHGGSMRIFLMRIGYMPYGMLPPRSIENTGYIIVRCDGRKFVIQKVEGIAPVSMIRKWG